MLPSTVPFRRALPLLLGVSLLPPPMASAQEGLKVYISADMEGVVGVVRRVWWEC